MIHHYGMRPCQRSLLLGLALVSASCGSEPVASEPTPSPSPSPSPSAAAVEGYGYQTVGGGGGNTCRVTTLAGSGPGSFTNCVEGSNAPRIVVFDVAGVITLDQTLYINAPYLTIDGTTAPAPGITIRPNNSSRTALAIENTHDVIVRSIRMQGYGTEDGADLLRIDGDVGEVYNVIADHLTLIAADDGALDITYTARDITVSWCFFYDNTLTNLVKYGSNKRITFHHNVWARNFERNPLIWGDVDDFDFVNNIVYDWSQFGMGIDHGLDGVDPDARVNANVVNNLFSAGNGNPDAAIQYAPFGAPADGYRGPAGQGDVVATSHMGELWVAGNILPSSNIYEWSTVTAMRNVPSAARVSMVPASNLRALLPPSVGTPYRTGTEQALLDEVARAAVSTSGRWRDIVTFFTTGRRRDAGHR